MKIYCKCGTPKWKKTFVETKQINNLIYNFPDIPEKKVIILKNILYILVNTIQKLGGCTIFTLNKDIFI